MNDLRYATRQLRKNPVFTLVAVATLGLGIGMNVAIFSVAQTALRPALPFEDADEIGGFDIVAFGVAVGLLSLTALAAGAIPAVRAARIDPVQALGAE